MNPVRLTAIGLFLAAAAMSYCLGISALRGRPILLGRRRLRGISARRIGWADVLYGTGAALLGASIAVQDELVASIAIGLPGLLCSFSALYLQRGPAGSQAA